MSRPSVEVRSKREGTLIVVCCHAIYHPSAGRLHPQRRSPFDEETWLLAPFQHSRGEPGSSDYKEGEHLVFLRHIFAGILRLLSCLSSKTEGSARFGNPNQPLQEGEQLYMPDKKLPQFKNHTCKPAHIFFSGAATKRWEGCDTTEARSYLMAFHDVLNPSAYAVRIPVDLRQQIDTIVSLIDATPDLSTFKGNMHCEELATDSYQNILFSLLAYRRVTGAWPERLLIVTHAFKIPRVRDCHLKAIRWPMDRCEVIGIDPPFSSAQEEAETREGERQRGYMAWSQDLYGSKQGGILRKKRQERGWDEVDDLRKVEVLVDRIENEDTGELRRLLMWQGGDDGTELFPEKLPWEDPMPIQEL